MKISEMIKNLQEFKDEHGDLDCWYSRDDEGNGYQAVYFEPSMRWVDSYSEMHHDEEDLADYDLTFDDVTPVCIIN